MRFSLFGLRPKKHSPDGMAKHPLTIPPCTKQMRKAKSIAINEASLCLLKSNTCYGELEKGFQPV